MHILYTIQSHHAENTVHYHLYYTHIYSSFVDAVAVVLAVVVVVVVTTHICAH